jgi:hypothetical protein
MPGKIGKLHRLEVIMIRWLEAKVNPLKGHFTDEDRVLKDSWKKTFTYVLKCEQRPLTKEDMQKLNRLYKNYNLWLHGIGMEYMKNCAA